ncbi:hypothetical protein BOTBODRAFT_640799 [Botryobasidium botryosum FD-172 SS1]|uniref:Uncharacterized protein n=1 Tax=Botryobasidium botryosum (strain FD-172 SS1) TaxID=930990 RepID=A0A067M2U6_BOTB1|nr:hypothetical protein BOTBODRAFT_640799 [Botryobasidium botryosum FD-172 SS1]
MTMINDTKVKVSIQGACGAIVAQQLVLDVRLVHFICQPATAQWKRISERLGNTHASTPPRSQKLRSVEASVRSAVIDSSQPGFAFALKLELEAYGQAAMIMDAAILDLLRKALRDQAGNVRDSLQTVERNDEGHQQSKPIGKSTNAALMRSIDDEWMAMVDTYHHFVHALSTHTARRLSALAARQNDLGPTACLPDEILYIIFEFVVETRRWLYPPNAREPLVLSHVSKRWRNIALRTPIIWTMVNSLNYSLVELFIARSQSAPLHIQLECAILYNTDGVVDIEGEELTPELRRHKFLLRRGRDSRDIIRLLEKLLIPQVHRWKTLQLTLVVPDNFEELFASPAPLLECFHYKNPKRSSVLSASPVPNLFSGQAPCLRELFLTRIYLPFATSLYSGVSRLELQAITFDLSLQQFVRGLGNCTSLSYLSLGQLQFLDEGSPLFSAPIPLPNLEKVIVTLDTDVIRDILSSIVIPASSHLVIWRFEEDLETFFSLLKGSLLNVPKIRSLQVSCDSDTVNLTGRASKGGARLLSISIPEEPTQESLQKLFLDLTQVVLPSSIDVLNLGWISNDLSHPSALSAALGLFPALTTLILTSCSPKLLDALIVRDTSCAVPRLEDLRLGEMEDEAESMLLRVVQSRMSQNETHENMVCLSRLTLYRDFKLAPETMLELKQYDSLEKNENSWDSVSGWKGLAKMIILKPKGILAGSLGLAKVLEASPCPFHCTAFRPTVPQVRFVAYRLAAIYFRRLNTVAERRFGENMKCPGCIIPLILSISQTRRILNLPLASRYSAMQRLWSAISLNSGTRQTEHLTRLPLGRFTFNANSALCSGNGKLPAVCAANTIALAALYEFATIDAIVTTRALSEKSDNARASSILETALLRQVVILPVGVLALAIMASQRAMEISQSSYVAETGESA